MRIAYLMVAHDNPHVLERAISALNGEDCSFFIHIDRKANIHDFLSIKGKNVFFIQKRIRVHWGEFSQVQAILLLLRKALATRDYDYFCLLSGSDYPLRSGNYIRGFLKDNRGLEFISMVKVPAPGKPLARINTIRFPSNKPVRQFLFRLLATFDLAQRDYRKYFDLEPYAGETWWALSQNACKFILGFSDRNRHVERYFQHSFASDESFFHTILGNSEFKTRIRRSLHYTDWASQGSHPAMINDRHVAFWETQKKILVSDMYGSGEVLFARKFADRDLKLLDRIDQMMLRNEDRLPQERTHSHPTVA
jgi:hypothetical protein